MDQLTNYKHKIDFLLISNDTSSIQTIVKSKYKKKKCNECNKRRMTLDKSHQICHVCYKAKKLVQSGNKIIDDFIRHTNVHLTTTRAKKMKFIPYNQFKNVKFIAEGGFSKIYKATWVGARGNRRRHVVLKKLNNYNITSKELNEVCTMYNILD